MTILTIDGGTTNTRLYRMTDGEILEIRKLSTGIRDTLTPPGRDAYITALTKEIAAVTVVEPTPEAIVCSGMIGSATGLALCPHILAPVSFETLAKKLLPVSLPDVSPLPFYFVPGLKTWDSAAGSASVDNLSEMDIMRGEETEMCGILSKMGLSGNCTLVLPGSHMKYISVDETYRITGFRTALTGEMLRALTEHTILHSSLADGFTKNLHTDGLLDGAKLAKKLGIAGALFKVRVLDMAVSPEKEYLFSFLLGILLSEDVDWLGRSGSAITVAGSEPFRSGYVTLLAEYGIPVNVVPAETAEHAAAYGADWLWRRYCEM